jgi:hypothetical protein
MTLHLLDAPVLLPTSGLWALGLLGKGKPKECQSVMHDKREMGLHTDEFES